MKRNTRVETNNVLCLGWVMASLVFIILLFIMYILYACIFFLYSKSVYQMTMSFITNDSKSGERFALVMIPLPWSPWPLRCCVLFYFIDEGHLKCFKTTSCCFLLLQVMQTHIQKGKKKNYKTWLSSWQTSVIRLPHRLLATLWMGYFWVRYPGSCDSITCHELKKSVDVAGILWLL